jgi:hypothetical protein
MILLQSDESSDGSAYVATGASGGLQTIPSVFQAPLNLGWRILAAIRAANTDAFMINSAVAAR